MNFLCHKNTFWFGQRSFNVHAIIEPQSEQRYGQPINSGPCGKTLGFSAKLDKALSGLVGSVSGVWLRRKRLLNRPSISESPCKITGIKSKLPCPCADVLCLARKLNVYVAGQIGLLLFYRCPSTVFWSVPLVTVETINGSSSGAISHVSQEVLERLTPAVADRYAATSVSGKPRACWSIASGEHVVVSDVSWALRFLCRMAVRFAHNILRACNKLIIRTKISNDKRRNAEMAPCLA